MDLLSEECTTKCADDGAAARMLILLTIAMVVAAYAFVASTWTGVLGQTDRLWSILPTLYSWLLHYFQPTPRGLLAAILVSVWSIRLTYNFARKGGFYEEDYRWAYMRAWFPTKLGFTCFNFWFISIAQNLFIIGFTLPAYVATLHPSTPLGYLDWASAASMASFILLESIADQQQWNYQTAKKAAKVDPAFVYRRGFLCEGLFRYSRHPNFFAEISIWWAFYGFSVAASGSFVHWSGVGALILTLIFHGSADLTEKISSSKYPLYAEYQKETSRIVPWFATAQGRKQD